MNYATTNVTAHAGVDYQAVSGTLTFAPGTRQRTLTVPILGDTTVDGDRYFKVLLSNAVNATVLQEIGIQNFADGACTIVDDDSGPYIVNDSPLPDAYVGIPYSVAFTVGNASGTGSFSLQSEGVPIPPGLVFNGASGVLSGTPTAATTSPYFFILSYFALPVSPMREYRLIIHDDRIFADGFESAGASGPARDVSSSMAAAVRYGQVDPTTIPLGQMHRQ